MQQDAVFNPISRSWIRRDSPIYARLIEFGVVKDDSYVKMKGNRGDFLKEAAKLTRAVNDIRLKDSRLGIRKSQFDEPEGDEKSTNVQKQTMVKPALVSTTKPALVSTTKPSLVSTTKPASLPAPLPAAPAPLPAPSPAPLPAAPKKSNAQAKKIVRASIKKIFAENEDELCELSEDDAFDFVLTKLRERPSKSRD